MPCDRSCVRRPTSGHLKKPEASYGDPQRGLLNIASPLSCATGLGPRDGSAAAILRNPTTLTWVTERPPDVCEAQAPLVCKGRLHAGTDGFRVTGGRYEAGEVTLLPRDRKSARSPVRQKRGIRLQ